MNKIECPHCGAEFTLVVIAKPVIQGPLKCLDCRFSMLTNAGHSSAHDEISCRKGIYQYVCLDFLLPANTGRIGAPRIRETIEKCHLMEIR